MDEASAKVRILLIRPWTHPVAPIRAALREAGLAALITHVDIEPALNAALTRGGFDIVVFDPSSTELSFETVEARLREHPRIIPLVTLLAIDELGNVVKNALLTWLN